MPKNLLSLSLTFLLALVLLPTNELDAYEPLVTIGKPALQDVLYSPDGRFLATLTYFYLELLDAETFASVIQAPIYEDGETLAFSPDSSLLAISGSREGIQIWHVDSEKFVATIPVRTRDAEFSPDGKYLAYAIEDSVFLWDVEQKKTVLELPGAGHRVKKIAFHPGSKMLAVGYSGGRDIALWHIETEEVLSYLELQLKRAGSVRAMRFSRDGARLAALVSFVGTVNDQAGTAVILLDVSTGDLHNWDGEFSDVIFAPDNQRLLVGGRDGNLHIIDLDTFSVEKIPAVDHMPPPWADGFVRLENLTIHPDGSRIASLINDSRVRVWDTQDFSRLGNLYGYGWAHSTADALYLPEVNRIVTGVYTDVFYFWDGTTGELLKAVEFDEHADYVCGLSVSPDGTKVGMAIGQTSQIWDAATAERLAIFSLDCWPAGGGGTAFSPSGKSFVYMGMCGSHFWDIETGEKITWEPEDMMEREHMDKNWTDYSLVVFSSDGKQMVAIPRNFGGPKTMIWDFETGLPVSETSHIGPVVDVGIDFLQAYQIDETIEIRFLKSNGLLSRISDKLPEWDNRDIFRQIRFHPSGNVLVLRYDSYNYYYSVPGEYEFYDVWSGELISTASGIRDLQFAADGSYMFLVDDEGQLGLYRTSDVIGKSVVSVFAVNPVGKKITTFGQIKQNQLLQNYPNPFNPDTWIPYQLAEDSTATITIYDATGKVVRTLDLGHRKAGCYITKDKAAFWDGRNDKGEEAASGLYFCQLKAGSSSDTRKMILAQ